jgi:hypothetical protein
MLNILAQDMIEFRHEGLILQVLNQSLQSQIMVECVHIGPLKT